MSPNKMRHLKKLINNKKLSIFFLCILFFIFNVIFNYRLFQELISNFNNAVVPVNDGIINEFLTEVIYQNVLNFRNPFTPTDLLFYPYETNFAISDASAINTIYLLFLRLFTEIHRSTVFIVFINFFFAEVCMYALLREFKINRFISFLYSLIFAFSPFLSYRVIGHYTYTAVYFFPLTFLLILYYLKAKTHITKLIISVILGITCVLFWFANHYYFIMSVLALLFYISYYVMRHKNIFLELIKTHTWYLVSFSVTFILLMIPWLHALFYLKYFHYQPPAVGFNGAIELSADVLNFITPSEYNPFYRYLIDAITPNFPFSERFSHFYYFNWSRLAYPGILIIAPYGYLLLFRKSIFASLRRAVNPHFLVSIIFATLCLGPFLKVFNRWRFVFEDVSVIVPLPFLILHYIPGFDLLRAPARFIAAFVFFGSLVSALIMHRIFIRLKVGKQVLIGVVLVFIFFIDQFYIIPADPPLKMPNVIYKHIERDREKATVLEIPFAARDGLEYVGFVHAVSVTKAPLLTGKSIIGGYLARVHPDTFTYYRSLPLIGYIGRTIDQGNYNPHKEKPKKIVLKKMYSAQEDLVREVNFLDIKYIILRDGKPYTKTIKKIIEPIGFRLILSAENYSLFERPTVRQEFSTIDFGSQEDHLYLAENFSIKEDGYRWAVGKSALIFLKTYRTDSSSLRFTLSSFYQNQKVRVYVNNAFAGAREISTMKRHYSVNVSGLLRKGMNRIVFVFSKNFKPALVLSNNQDERDLAVKFYKLTLNK